MAEVTTLVAQAIEDRIRDNVDSFGGTIAIDRIAWQGMDFQPGEDDWLRPTTLFAGSEWLTDGVTGTGQNLIRGVLSLQFFANPGWGMSALDGYASEAREMFDRVKLTIADHGALQFGPAGGPVPGFDGAWLSNTVDVPFQIEEHG